MADSGGMAIVMLEIVESRSSCSLVNESDVTGYVEVVRRVFDAYD